MRHRRIIGALALVAGATTCVAPTDSSDKLQVQVAPMGELIPGDTVMVAASLVRAGGGEVPNATFSFSTSDATIILLQPDGRLIAANAGTATVTVASLSAAEAKPAQLPVTVRPPVTIDSVHPATVRYGEDLIVYGRGLDPAGGALVASIDGVSLPVIGYVPADAADPARQGALAVRVAPPLRTATTGPGTANIIVTGSRGAASADLPLSVTQKDIFEPNALVPGSLGVITARTEWIGLAFEPGDTVAPGDWYTFTTTAPGDWTVTMAWGQSPADIARVVAVPAGTVDAFGAQDFQGITPVYFPNGVSTVGSMSICRGEAVYYEDNFGGPGLPNAAGAGGPITGPVVTSLVLRALPAGVHHLMLGSVSLATAAGRGIPGPDRFGFAFDFPFFSSLPVRYDLTIEPGDHSPLAPDAYEPNNTCEAAPDFLSLGATPVVDSIISLTAESERENDWLRVVVTQPGTLMMDFRVPAAPGVLGGSLIHDAAPPDSMYFLATSATSATAGWTPPGGGWDGSFVTCAPDPNAGFNFNCPSGEGFTSSVPLAAGNYLLHFGAAGRAAAYDIRLSWTP